MPIEDIRADRLKKLEALLKKGINPYPATAKKEQAVSDLLKNFEAWEAEKKGVFTAGRLISKREHGALVFCDLYSNGSKIQLMFRKDILGEEQFDLFVNYFDIGDFVNVSGFLFRSKRGEMTLEVKYFKMLAKSIQALPEKWHGLQDEEEKLRKRYLDILFNDDVRQTVERRAKFWQAMRDFLLKRGFLEVETPVLETTPGGADARPFVTHHNALDIDVHLRISMGELWQKRLMVAGFEKTFEIGRQFRNEGMSAEHLQDYTQMEFYWAYADHKEGMKLAEEMYKYVAQETFGTLKFTIGNFEVDLSKEWETYDYVSTIKKMTGIDVLHADKKEIEAKLKDLKIEYDKKGFNITRAVDNLWKYCRKQIGGPGFLVNVPVLMEPLAKRSEENPELVQRFQIIIAGSEVGKGYSELNDPIDQANRFAAQQKLRDAGDEEAQMYDHDFVEALEYGMPPTCGFGVSERLFAFLAGKPVRECQIFPLMRPKEMPAKKLKAKSPKTKTKAQKPKVKAKKLVKKVKKTTKKKK
jgi:lysyl-tRNA synthetase class 2